MTKHEQLAYSELASSVITQAIADLRAGPVKKGSRGRSRGWDSHFKTALLFFHSGDYRIYAAIAKFTQSITHEQIMDAFEESLDGLSDPQTKEIIEDVINESNHERISEP